MTKTQGYIIIVLLSCLLIVAGTHVVLTLVTAVWPAVSQVSTAAALAVEPELLTTVKFPDAVTVDEEFDVVVEATNPHAKAIPLGHVDFELALMSGFRVVSVTPEAVETPNYAAYQRWSFSKLVEPGASQTVTFRLRAVRPGNFAGDIDVCNPNEDCTTKHVIVHVKNVEPAQSAVGESKE